MLPFLPFALTALSAPTAPPDLWALARQNAGTLRFSTLVCADQVDRFLKDDAGIDTAIAWCKDHAITHIYIESHRSGPWPTKATLTHARDRFRQAGLLVSGCITTVDFGKRGSGWSLLACYTNADTQRQLKEIFQYAASVFDEIMIDDFLFTDCQCPECTAARGSQSWADYRCDLMLRLSKEDIMDAARAVNPKARIILKYPCWHENFQERGYDVERQSRLYDKTWVGTETRGGTDDPNWRPEPQYRAYWLMRWLGGIGGEKCGGGWYDTLGTNPAYYLEQGRQTILGGAREAFLFNFGDLTTSNLGKQDADALREEIPGQFELARLIKGKRPRGINGWKPASSPAAGDNNIHSLLGMAGFPVTAEHEFDPKAPGWIFAAQALHDPAWPEDLRRALASRAPILVTPRFLDGAASSGKAADLIADLKARAIPLPASADPNRWQAIEALPQPELDALRDRATANLGVRFHAPARVALYLFGDDTVVIESFRDEPAQLTLAIEGWRAFAMPLALPQSGAPAAPGGSTASLTLPPRSLVVLQRK